MRRSASMDAPAVVFLDAASLGGGLDTTALEQAAGRLQLHAFTRPEEVLERLQETAVAICNKTRLDAASLAALPRLRLVLVTATGTDNIDLDAAARQGVEVRNCRNYGTDSVAQHTLMLMLALHARLLPYQQQLRQGDWSRADRFCLMDLPIRELAGRRLGIFGAGAIGRAVGALAEAFGMQVRFARLPGRPEQAGRIPWQRLLAESDVISLHCPLTAETRGLIDAAALARLPDGAILINTARAGLVETPALIAALRSGQLAGAGLDGLDQEPPPPDHPLLAADIPNLLLTPHNAWASLRARQNLVEQTAENLLAWRRGEALRCVGRD